MSTGCDERRTPLDLSGLPDVDHLVAQEYDVFLSQLTFNSKEIINALTRIAEENKHVSPAIAFVLESRILNAEPDKKLPLVYLLDSILKNVKNPYLDLFAVRVPKLMPRVYASCTTDVRARLRKLVSTWPPYFGQQIVSIIATEFNKLDVAQQSGLTAASLYANPEFARSNVQNMAAVASAFPSATVSAHTAQPSHTPLAMQQHHVMQLAQPPILPSHNQTALVELENEARHLIERINFDTHRGLAPSLDRAARLQANIAAQLQLVTDIHKRRSLEALRSSIMAAAPQPAPFPAAPHNQGLSFGMQSTVPSVFQHQQKPVPPAQATAPGAGGPQLCASFELLKSSAHDGAVRLLYDDLQHVSRMDGSRFATKDQLRAHLDWLFEHQKRKRKSAAHSRTWFATESDWRNNVKDVKLSGADVAAIFENAAANRAATSGAAGTASRKSGAASEPNDELAERSKARGFKRMANDSREDYVEEDDAVLEAPGDGDELCGMCEEKIDIMWNDTRQAWFLQGAVKVGEELFHKKCYYINSPIPRSLAHSEFDGPRPSEAGANEVGARASKKLRVDGSPSKAELKLS